MMEKNDLSSRRREEAGFRTLQTSRLVTSAATNVDLIS
jgi:hypothetical protein